MKKINILILMTLSFSINAQNNPNWYNDYVFGVTDVTDMLTDNPNVIESVGPLAGQFYVNGMDYGFGFEPNLTNSVGLNETQFLSFELNYVDLFDDPSVHFIAAMRGLSNVPNLLLGRGLAIGNTPGCLEGIQIEDFTINALNGGGSGPNGNPLKGCQPYYFQNNRTYRFDMEATIYSLNYKMYRLNTPYEQNAYNLNKWSPINNGQCGTPPFLLCPQQSLDDGGQNIILGTAGRTQFTSATAGNVYVAKWPN